MGWRRKFSSICCAVVLAGCATATEVGLPDGTSGYALNCTGTANGWGDCLNKAAEKCQGRGYEILTRDERTGYLTSFTPTQFGVVGSATPVPNREMIVKCK